MPVLFWSGLVIAVGGLLLMVAGTWSARPRPSVPNEISCVEHWGTPAERQHRCIYLPGGALRIIE